MLRRSEGAKWRSRERAVQSKERYVGQVFDEGWGKGDCIFSLEEQEG